MRKNVRQRLFFKVVNGSEKRERDKSQKKKKNNCIFFSMFEVSY